MYSILDERKSDVAEKSIRALKNKICKYMTSIPKNLYIDKLDVNKYNNRQLINTIIRIIEQLK